MQRVPWIPPTTVPTVPTVPTVAFAVIEGVWAAFAAVFAEGGVEKLVPSRSFLLYKQRV